MVVWWTVVSGQPSGEAFRVFVFGLLHLLTTIAVRGFANGSRGWFSRCRTAISDLLGCFQAGVGVEAS